MKRNLFLGSMCIAPALAIACQSIDFTTERESAPADAAVKDTGVAPPFVPGETEEDSGTPISDAGTLATCSATASFAAPTRIPGLPEGAIGLRFSPDEKTATFHVTNQSPSQIYQATRATRLDAFGTPSPISLTIDQTDAGPDSGYTGPPSFVYASLTGDRTKIYVSSAGAIYTSRSTAGSFGPLQKVSSFVGGGFLYFNNPYVTEDGSLLFVSNVFFGAGDQRVATVSGESVGEGTLIDVGSNGRNHSFIVNRETTLAYYATNREADAGGPYQIWRATRLSANDAWANATPVVELRSLSTANYPMWISQDQCRLYFESNRSGSMNSYVTERTP